MPRTRSLSEEIQQYLAYFDEDQVAASCDHAVVERAIPAGDGVEFCAVQGGVDGQRLRTAARRLKGLAVPSGRLHGAASAR